jgi:CheY-like chemotaxis protein
LITAEYNTPSLINDTANLNSVRIGSKPVKFRLHVDENLPAKLRGDELGIKQIFNNLLSNAFKYTNEGIVDWYIKARREGDQVWLESRVEDTGIGITKEDIPKLFSDYSQADSKSSRKIEGTGQELSIIRRMAGLMGGDITVESEYGRGSVFTVRIRQEAAGEEVIGRDTAANLAEFNYTRRRRTQNQKFIHAPIPYASVLVVDDVPINLEVAKGILKPYRMTIDCVGSGQDAINRIREGTPRYSAVFMDQMMPEMDGMETTRIIREEIGTDYAKSIPIIALTADAITGNEQIFLDRGFQALLTKPIDIMQLDSVLNRWVRDKKQETYPAVKEARIGETGRDKAAAQREASLRKAAKDIDGFDSNTGLDMVKGDIESWLEVVRSFVSHTPSLLRFMQNLSRENLPEFTIKVHGIKGACYGLGAAAVGKAAEELERRGRAGDFDFVRTHVGSFIARTGKLLEDLRSLLMKAEDEDQRSRKPVPDRDILAAVREAAAAYDMESLEAAVSTLEQYRYETEQDLVLWLREQCNISEFAAIQERLARNQYKK